MRRRKSTFSISLIVLSAFILGSCAGILDRPPREDRGEETPVTGREDERGVNPLDLAEDREIIPQLRPQAGAITGANVPTGQATDQADSLLVEPNTVIAEPQAGSNQVFRVQLFTSKLFGEARRETLVAEEIFDQPVSTDYEVPYFKVRVGDFATRDAAESYLEKAKAAGYPSAFVVLVTTNVNEAAPLYEDLPPQTLPDSANLPEPDVN